MHNNQYNTTMKRFFSIMIAVAMMFAFAACNSSNVKEGADSKNDNPLTYDGRKVTKQLKSLPYFNKVVLDGALDVEFSQASRGGVAIKGRKSIVDNVKVKVKNQTLYLSLDEKDWFRVDHSEKADIYVSSPDLISVVMRGAGDFEAKNLLDTDTLNVELNGAGNIDFDRIVCDEAYLIVKGAGNLEVDKLTANRTKIAMLGVGNADVEFKNAGHVDCLLSGVGNIDLEGTVKSLSKNVRGTGNIDTTELMVHGSRK